MINLAKLYNFRSKLWYDKRWVSSTGIVSLYLQVYLNKKHKEFPLRLRWPVNKIDMVNGILLPQKKGDNEVDDLNILIRLEQSKHSEILRTYRIKGKPIDLKIFAKELKIFEQNGSFVSYMYRKTEDRLLNKEIEEHTRRNHHSANELMIEFNTTWQFDQLSVDMMAKFKAFLTHREYKPGVKHKPGYIWTVIKTVKTYLQFTVDEPMLNVEQEVADFPNPQPKWKTNFLNKDELTRILKLYKSGYLNRDQLVVCRAFLFTCFTSLRISDLYRVNTGWRLNEGFLDFIPKKNHKKQKWVHIPIMKMANKFIQNTVGNYFTLPSEQEYNRTLKEIASLAVVHKKLTSHVGRHTFGYLYMTTAGNLKGLQEILGHSKIDTTMRYAHLDDDYLTESVQKIEDEFSDVVTWR